MKTEIKNRTEITGFLAVITKIPDKTAPKARRSNKKLFINKNAQLEP
jgi:hypothetical protein